MRISAAMTHPSLCVPDSGTKFRRLFCTLAQMEGSQNCQSSYRRVLSCRDGKHALDCLALTPSEFYAQAYRDSSAGYMERARVLQLYTFLHKRVEDARAAAGRSGGDVSDAERTAADAAVAELENTGHSLFESLRNIDREEALRILRDSDVALTSAIRSTIRREVRETMTWPATPPTSPRTPNYNVTGLGDGVQDQSYNNWTVLVAYVPVFPMLVTAIPTQMFQVGAQPSL